MHLQHAFKEWAVICKALAEGRQGIILRKGGIAEESGDFTLEQPRFWLFPTYTHQQKTGIQSDALPLLEAAQNEQPAPGIVRLSHWAEVTGIYRIRALTPALLLGHLHIWSDETVRKRFAYRQPEINVLAVRVYQAPDAHVVGDTPAYQGCKSWVTLDQPWSTEGSVPVLADKDYQDVKWHLEMLLNPTGTA